ncbi:hypothetical protein SAMN05421786_102432 [Chryseobacterium ureilyticum]|uniref:Uncharacterized protein n=1 Tax=Chryseobacterium ureilyticum TaxID=373668 RepID=A0A1N7MBI5_9FLAO|nr:hypothetical protein [Chryseobacterium ureilyticum]SIS83341.1 hypothetical protein SAMN05421786_102432 [Chryseobacterium ureilyticum]
MKLRLFFIFFTFSIIKILATGQVPDRIIINNKEYKLLNNPLEKYFDEHPDEHPVYGNKDLKEGINEVITIGTSSNHRGYIATFKIENNILSVVDIKILDVNSDKYEYISVFKKTFGDKKIELNYSGVLIIPQGKLIQSADFGYSSLYDKYQVITVQRDKIVKDKELDQDGFIRFKVDQFEAYKKTEKYKADVKKYLEDWNDSKKSDLSRENTRGMSKKEIAQLKKEYETPPNEEYIENFLFVIENLDDIIVDY